MTTTDRPDLVTRKTASEVPAAGELQSGRGGGPFVSRVQWRRPDEVRRWLRVDEVGRITRAKGVTSTSAIR